tara:strand:- start:279 stop:731 length:453 start_codon:yes stop_codon:yes gene_type:complete
LRNSERTGRSGEYFVCSVLSLYSDSVAILPQGSQADLIFEYKNKVYRCQVKTASMKQKIISKHTGRTYRTNYRFDFRRGSHTKNRNYIKGTIDIWACCILPEYKVIFLPGNYNKQSIRFSEDKLKKLSSKKTFVDAVNKKINKQIIELIN